MGRDHTASQHNPRSVYKQVLSAYNPHFFLSNFFFRPSSLKLDVGKLAQSSILWNDFTTIARYRFFDSASLERESYNPPHIIVFKPKKAYHSDDLSYYRLTKGD